MQGSASFLSERVMMMMLGVKPAATLEKGKIEFYVIADGQIVAFLACNDFAAGLHRLSQWVQAERERERRVHRLEIVERQIHGA